MIITMPENVSTQVHNTILMDWVMIIDCPCLGAAFRSSGFIGAGSKLFTMDLLVRLIKKTAVVLTVS